MNGTTNGHDDLDIVGSLEFDYEPNIIEGDLVNQLQEISDEVNEDDSLIFREPSVESEDTPEKRWEVGHFDPPLYRQRYDKVLTLLQNDLWKNVMSRVADFGCAEAKFVVMLKSLPRVREAIGVDINENLLDLFRHRIEPLFIDYLEPRPETPLSMYLMAGSVAEVDVRLLDIDAVTSIELIEHLEDDVLKAYGETVFGSIKPKLVIVTTPNREYNVLFENFDGPFRHWDHKFEWNRDQFRNWAEDVVDKYPDYLIECFTGVGEGPPSIGYCSQIVVFARKDFFSEAVNGTFAEVNLADDDCASNSRMFLKDYANQQNDDFRYKTVTYYDYPVRRDLRTRDEKILDEAKFHLYQIAWTSEEWADHLDAEVAIDDLFELSRLQAMEPEVTHEEVRDVLRPHFEIKTTGDKSVVVVPYEEQEESDYEDEEYFGVLEPNDEASDDESYETAEEDWDQAD